MVISRDPHAVSVQRLRDMKNSTLKERSIFFSLKASTERVQKNGKSQPKMVADLKEIVHNRTVVQVNSVVVTA